MRKLIFSVVVPVLAVSCARVPEMTLEEIEEYRERHREQLLEMTVSRPYRGEEFADGRGGGVWNATISGDPKSFNHLIAERDGETAGILSPLLDSLVDYDTVRKEWVPRLASFRVEADAESGTMDLFYTLRDDIYWSVYGSPEKVRVTSDDVVFWYDEICGDEEMASSAYNGQFMQMDDGTERRIEIEKIDERNFVFHFPRIVSEPLLTTNMSFGPRYLYKKAKDEGGVQGVKDLHSVDVDPRSIPSVGKYFIAEYTPGQRIVYERNDDFWERDGNGLSIAYPRTRVAKIVGDRNTESLLFSKGEIETFSPSPEQLESVVSRAENAFGADGRFEKRSGGYTVFSSEGSMGASFWTFNQNPRNASEPHYRWFTQKKFRQAMSCLLNRERIIAQTYRGLAEPKYSFFPEANAFFDPSVELQFKFSRERARALLSEIGFARGDDGFLHDPEGNRVEFDLTIVSSNPVMSDIAQIIADECKQEGIVVNARQTDFQRLVEQLTSTYDWQSLIIGLSGSALFPIQGSNVWPSSGNLHMWNPLQKTPATDWEARIDRIFNEANCIVDKERAFPLWSEYQRIILDECPVIYLVRPRNFFAIQNRWNLTNVYYDSMRGAETEHCFLAE